MIKVKILQFRVYIFTFFIFIIITTTTTTNTTTIIIFILNYAGLGSIVFSHTFLNVVGLAIYSSGAHNVFIPTVCISVLHLHCISL
jgi:hypothetical protein